MGLKTRIDKRSPTNSEFIVVNTLSGECVSVVKATSCKVSLEITTARGYHIEKPNGFTSAPTEEVTTNEAADSIRAEES